jgi:hypothetical protein
MSTMGNVQLDVDRRHESHVARADPPLDARANDASAPSMPQFANHHPAKAPRPEPRIEEGRRVGGGSRKVQLKASSATRCTLTMSTMGNVQLDVTGGTSRTFHRARHRHVATNAPRA